MMSNTQTAALIVGTLMPFLITVVKQAGLPRWGNLLISVAACTGAGVLTAWAAGTFKTADVLSAVMVVFVAAQAVYAAYWRNVDLEPKLNDATSIIKSGV
jgi:ABC-type uncharacterized transport system permease subunit